MSSWEKALKTIKTIFAVILFIGFTIFLFWAGVAFVTGGVSIEEYFKKLYVTPQPTYVPPAEGESSAGISNVDGMELIYIPAGEFLMGSKETDVSAPQGLLGLQWSPDAHEMPQHAVFLDAFWIDKTEVTNQQYQMCIEAGICSSPSLKRFFDLDPVANSWYGEYPVVFISWQDAVTYCNWAGRRLPTEAEWEKAARGIDGWIYPWGNEAPGSGLLYMTSRNVQPVGNYPAGASPYGVLDMAGNATEWVSDWYSATYYLASPARNPLGPDSGEQHVLKGLGVGNILPFAYRTAYRKIYADQPFEGDAIGFRCAQTDATK